MEYTISFSNISKNAMQTELWISWAVKWCSCSWKLPCLHVDLERRFSEEFGRRVYRKNKFMSENKDVNVEITITDTDTIRNQILYNYLWLENCSRITKTRHHGILFYVLSGSSLMLQMKKLQQNHYRNSKRINSTKACRIIINLPNNLQFCRFQTYFLENTLMEFSPTLIISYRLRQLSNISFEVVWIKKNCLLTDAVFLAAVSIQRMRIFTASWKVFLLVQFSLSIYWATCW